jgi:predicted ATPase
LAFALNCAATILAWRGEGGESLKYADALLALAKEQGFTNWHSFAQIVRGQALALLGKGDEAIDELKHGIASYESSGAVIPGWMYLVLGLGYLSANQPEEGFRVVSRGLNEAEKTSGEQTKADLYRLRGELLLMCEGNDAIEAEASFRAAIKTAREQHARFPELHATTSLARLLRDTGRRDEARTMITEIYNWFTEGFDTADLKEARALLEELGS